MSILDKRMVSSLFASFNILYVLAFAIIPAHTKAQSTLQPFRLQQVSLLPGIFKDAQQTNLRYMLSLDPDRLLAPYLKAAGLNPKKRIMATGKIPGLTGT